MFSRATSGRAPGLASIAGCALAWGLAAATPAPAPAAEVPGLASVLAVPTGAGRADERIGGTAVVVAPGTAVTLQEAFPRAVAAGEVVTLLMPGGRRRTATVTRCGPATAVLLTLDTTGLPPLPLGDPARLPLGSPVWTVGNTTGAVEDDGAAAVSQGTISGRYDLPDDGLILRGRGGRILSTYRGPVIEVDAAVNDGNQGGAVLDDGGRLIALATMAIARERRLGTAVPIDRVLADVGLSLPVQIPIAGSAPAVPPGLAVVAFDRPDGLGNPEAVPRPPRTLEQVPAYERPRLEAWWDRYYHDQQRLWTDSPSPALIIDPARGLLLTAASNLHGEAVRGRVLLAGRGVPFVVTAVDAPLDLALLTAAGSLPGPGAVIEPLVLGPGGAVAVWGRHLVDGEPTRTAGHVSCIGRRLLRADAGFLQVDARADYASLGGAVVDGDGRIVGLVVRASPEAPWLINSGVTLAVDGATIARALPELIAGRGREKIAQLGLGVVLDHAEDRWTVGTVLPGTGAADAGIRPGDQLLTIDGRPSSSPQAVTRALLRHRVGELVPVNLRRAGRELTVAVELREFPQ